MSRRTFRHLCDELHIRLQHDSTLRQTITVEKREAVALWRLGTNVEYTEQSPISSVLECQLHVTLSMSFVEQSRRVSSTSMSRYHREMML